MTDCEHDFTYQGLIACNGDNLRPGSGAVNRYYAHVYFCRRCLQKRYENVPGDFNSYEKLENGAVLGSGVDRKTIVGHHEPSVGL